MSDEALEDCRAMLRVWESASVIAIDALTIIAQLDTHGSEVYHAPGIAREALSSYRAQIGEAKP